MLGPFTCTVGERVKFYDSLRRSIFINAQTPPLTSVISLCGQSSTACVHQSFLHGYPDRETGQIVADPSNSLVDTISGHAVRNLPSWLSISVDFLLPVFLRYLVQNGGNGLSEYFCLALYSLKLFFASQVGKEKVPGSNPGGAACYFSCLSAKRSLRECRCTLNITTLAST